MTDQAEAFPLGSCIPLQGMVTTTAPVVGIGTYGGDQTSSAAEAAERQEEGEKACAVRCEEG